MTSAGIYVIRLATCLLLAAAVVPALSAPAGLHAQASAADLAGPAFESAVITANTSGEPVRGRMNFEAAGRFTATNVTVRQLIETAYRRHAFDQREISGGPAWMYTDRFDVVAKAPTEHVFDSDGSPRQTWVMLRRLLADRFKLKVRRENREQPVYVIVVASGGGKLGPQLTRSSIDCSAIMANLMRGERQTGLRNVASARILVAWSHRP